MSLRCPYDVQITFSVQPPQGKLAIIVRIHGGYEDYKMNVRFPYNLLKVSVRFVLVCRQKKWQGDGKQCNLHNLHDNILLCPFKKAVMWSCKIEFSYMSWQAIFFVFQLNPLKKLQYLSF